MLYNYIVLDILGNWNILSFVMSFSVSTRSGPDFLAQQIAKQIVLSSSRLVGNWNFSVRADSPFNVRSSKDSNPLIVVCQDLCGQLNKLISVFYASPLLLMRNWVITLSKWLWNHKPQVSGFAVNFDNVTTKFIINKRADA